MNLIFIGSPGSGKGTISKILNQQFGYQHISTGDALRKEVKSGSSLGKEIDSLISKGNFVNDDLAFRIIVSSLDINKPFILDNFPRNEIQAKMLDSFLKDINFKVCFFDASNETVLNRLQYRRNCDKCERIYNIKTNPPKKDGICDNCNTILSQRSDDKKEHIENRLNIFSKAKEELLSYYNKRAIIINANKETDQVLEEIKKIIKK